MRPSPLLVLAVLALAGCDRATPLEPTGSEWVETFHSEVVNDDYLLRIRVPPDHDDSAGPYPLVVQLDPTFVGLEQYALTVGYVSQHAAAGGAEEAVVVGVDYPDPFTRMRDYAPQEPPDPDFDGDGADRFYRVLRDEVLPHVEATLDVDPTRRILVGHSNGGVFAWYATFRHEPDTGPLFRGVIAADAGIPASLFTLERWHAERSDGLPVQLFATRALYNGAAQAVPFDALVARVADRDYAGLDLRTEVLDTDHGGAVAPSYEAGLAWLLGRDR
jgi:hypothetical protein